MPRSRSLTLSTTLLYFAGSWSAAVADQIAYQPPSFDSSALVPNVSDTTGLIGADGSLAVPALAAALNLTVHWMAPVPPAGSSVTGSRISAAAATAASTAPPSSIDPASPKAMYAAPASQSLEWLSRSWSLWNSRLYGGDASNLAFIPDPFASLLLEPVQVLKVEYEKGSFKQSGPAGGGGATFYPSPPELGLARRALLNYQVAFDPLFDFVKGGKLPGFWSGKSASDCSGGKKSSDGSCFSVRMMWRSEGAGEGMRPTHRSVERS